MTARDLNLSNGVVSKIVLQQAGPGIQDECRKVSIIENFLNDV